MIWTHILCFILGAGIAVSGIYFGFWLNWKLTKPAGMSIITPKPEDIPLNVQENELDQDDIDAGDEKDFVSKPRSIFEALT